MEIDLLVNDRIINTFKQIIDESMQRLNVEVLSIVLYGSKARGDRNSINDYEFLILLKNDTPLMDFIKFNESLKIEIIKEKLMQIKYTTYTPEAFEELMYKEHMVGTFLYIICKENIILYDKQGTFSIIKDRVSRSDIKDEEEFLNQCIEFAKMMGSEKWQRKYEKALLQYKYTKRRRNV